jgi:hypothetical protein
VIVLRAGRCMLTIPPTGADWMPSTAPTSCWTVRPSAATKSQLLAPPPRRIPEHGYRLGYRMTFRGVQSRRHEMAQERFGTLASGGRAEAVSRKGIPSGPV